MLIWPRRHAVFIALVRTLTQEFRSDRLFRLSRDPVSCPTTGPLLHGSLTALRLRLGPVSKFGQCVKAHQ
jgi:hypothetical protein